MIVGALGCRRPGNEELDYPRVSEPTGIWAGRALLEYFMA